jgi:REP element-mobilizing transposase RayT
MARKLRYVPPDGLVEVTAKTIQGRYLLRPGPEMNRRFVGVVAKAKALYKVKVHSVSCLSNHWHGLVSPGDAQRLARFMNYVQGNLAREAGDLHDWDGPFWHDRYHSVLVSEEPEAQIQRLAYCLAQGAKKGLVARPELWPGVHSAHALRHGTPLRGVWYDRTAHCLAGRRKDEDSSLEEFASDETLQLDPLPCWESQGLSAAETTKLVAELLDRIAEETAARHRADGTCPSDPSVFLRVDPHQRPENTKRSPRPFVHAASREVRERFREAYRIFSTAYYEAVELLRTGHGTPCFPEGSFPPAAPFVPVLEPG